MKYTAQTGLWIYKASIRDAGTLTCIAVLGKIFKIRLGKPKTHYINFCQMRLFSPNYFKYEDKLSIERSVYIWPRKLPIQDIKIAGKKVLSN